MTLDTHSPQDDTITVQPLAAMTWEEARDAAGPGSVAILPVGAIEAHGPHLPLETDVIIAQAMAMKAGSRAPESGTRKAKVAKAIKTKTATKSVRRTVKAKAKRASK